MDTLLAKSNMIKGYKMSDRDISVLNCLFNFNFVFDDLINANGHLALGNLMLF